MNGRIIFTKNAPTPGGHYAQAIVHNGLLYLSGQLPIDPVSGKIVLGDLAQIDQVFRNMESILEEANSDWGNVLKLSIFLVKKDLWIPVNHKCQQVFGSHTPARTIVPEVGLKDGVMIEADLIATVATS